MSLQALTAFLTPDHHRVRDFAVTELPRAGAPLMPEAITAALGTDPARVRALLDELEAHKAFLYRDRLGRVEWAYPVTSALTPHRLTFDSGERIYGA